MRGKCRCDSDAFLEAKVAGTLCECVIHCCLEDHVGLVIVTHYPPRESLELVQARSSGKAVAFHTLHPPAQGGQ